MRRALLVMTLLLAGCGTSGNGVYTVDIASGEHEKLTPSVAQATWATGGAITLVERTRDGRHAIDTYAAGKWRPTVLVPTPPRATGFTVAPDGKRYAYVASSRSDLSGELTVGKRRLLARAVGDPAWSPDGRRLAVALSGERERVAVVDLGGRRIATVAGHSPRYVRDGRLAVQDEAGNLLIEGRVAARGLYERGLWDLAPSGDRIAISANGRLYIEDEDEGLRDLGLAGSDASWSPDGRRLAAVDGERVIVVDADSGKARQVARIDGHGLGRPAWSPDGRRLLVVATDPPSYD